MLSYAILAATHLKWAWNFLFRHSLLQKYEHENGPQIGVIRYERTPGFEETVECAVCLCKIEEGEEMRELRCDHLFHRDCLDRWLGHRHATCPLCRAFLAPRRRVAEDDVGEEEVILFKFCRSSSSSSDRRGWWLR